MGRFPTESKCRPERLLTSRSVKTRIAQDEEVLPADEVYDAAFDRALRLLTVRPRSQQELRDRLSRAGYGEEVVARVEARLLELSFLDDQAFAREWAEHAMTAKGLSSRAIRRGLEARGISSAGIDRALAELAPAEESSDAERALAVARRRAATYGGSPPAAAYRKLVSYLGQKGYEADLVFEVCRRVLGEPEEDPESGLIDRS